MMHLVIQKYLRNLIQPTDQRSVNLLGHKSAGTWTQIITISYGKTATFTVPLRSLLPLSWVIVTCFLLVTKKVRYADL